MRTLRYLGILVKTGLREEKADDLIEKIKSMPELLGKQEKVFLSQYGISLKELQEHSKYELLDMLRNLGKNMYISEKTKFIKDENQKRKKFKELMLRLGRTKVIFNMDVDDVTDIVSIFSKYKIYNEVVGYGKYCKFIVKDGLRIESKFVESEEYFVISKIM